MNKYPALKDHTILTQSDPIPQSVVSAAAEPDTVTVTRSWRDQLAIASRSVGEKKVKCVMKGEYKGNRG